MTTAKNNEFFKIALLTALSVLLVGFASPRSNAALAFGTSEAVVVDDEPEDEDENAVRYWGGDGETFVIPEGVETIWEKAFPGRGESTVVFPKNLRKIEQDAFRGWSALSSIDLPESLEELGSRAFSNCARLTTVVIPKNVAKIGAQPFRGCPLVTSIEVAEDNPYFCSVDGVVFTKDRKTLVSCPPGKNGEYVVPDGVTTLRLGAFAGCPQLTSIIIPTSVETIEREAFSGCVSLKSIGIPESVASIGDHAFAGCVSLESIALPNGVESLGYRILESCARLETVFIPESVQHIGDRAFDDCESLRAIEVSPGNANYRSIDGVLFADNGKTLVKYPERSERSGYVVPDGATTIGVAAFRKSATLKSLVVSNGVKTIEGEAFHHCAALESIAISESVETIDRYAFSYCSALQSIDVAENNANYRSIDGILYTKDVKTLIKCPEGSVIEELSLPDGVEAIEVLAFARCAALKSVVLPAGVRNIGSSAFSGCSGLTSIFIPESVGYIGGDPLEFSSSDALTIYAPRGSGAERYAKDKGIPFEPIDRLTVGRKGDVHVVLVVLTKPELDDVGKKWREKIEGALAGTLDDSAFGTLWSDVDVNLPAENRGGLGKSDVASFTFVSGEDATPWNIPKVCRKISEEAKSEDAILAIVLAPVYNPPDRRGYVDRMTIMPALQARKHRLIVLFTDYYGTTVNGFRKLRSTTKTQTRVPEFLPKKDPYLKRFLEESEGAFHISSEAFDKEAPIEVGAGSGSFEGTRFAGAFARFAANGCYLESELTPDGFFDLFNRELTREQLNCNASSRLKYCDQTPMLFRSTDYGEQKIDLDASEPISLKALRQADAERFATLKESGEFPENDGKFKFNMTTETFVPAAK